MIVEVHHCASTAAEVIVSEDRDGVNPPTQFRLLIAQDGRKFSISLETGDAVDFSPPNDFDDEVRLSRQIYKHTIEGG